LQLVLTAGSGTPEQVRLVGVELQSVCPHPCSDIVETGAAGNRELQRICRSRKPVYRRRTGEDKNRAVQQ